MKRSVRTGKASRPGIGVLLLTCSILLQSGLGSEAREVRRVLVFYELGQSSPAVSLLDREIRGTFEHSNYQIELYREYFDTNLFPDSVKQQELREFYIHKYRDRRPNLIIALGPTPLQFMVDSHAQLFAGIPIVFGGTSEPQANNPKLDSDFTGCWELFEPNKTLDAALRLRPGTRHVVVGGASAFDKNLEAIVRERLHSYEANLNFTYLTDLEIPALIERVKHLPDHTIVLYIHTGMDAKANRYIGASQAGPIITQAANAPVFVTSDVDLGQGGVGGYVESFASEGKIVGGIATRILNGERPQDIPVVRGANAYMFDWRALKRWGFSERELPPGSEVLYAGPSFVERTAWIWIAVLIALLLLTALAFYLRMKLLKERQLGLTGRLIDAQEKERSWLASEIHDDFSQRMALLALGLESAEEAVGTSPNEAIQRIHNLLNSASELGADLHTLSHRLHSSTLNKLGLVPGINSLCKEFAIHSGIEIDFFSDDVPRSVHPDAGLCAFRIVQEGLRNLKKHSGVARAQVNLRRVADTLHVSIRDEGIGFNLRELGKQGGLGIRSMEERVFVLGGRFEIHSEPGQGTEVKASIPLEPRLNQAAG